MTVINNCITALTNFITVLVISVARYKEYINWRISFSKFSDVLPAFTCAGTVGNL